MIRSWLLTKTLKSDQAVQIHRLTCLHRLHMPKDRFSHAWCLIYFLSSYAWHFMFNHHDSAYPTFKVIYLEISSNSGVSWKSNILSCCSVVSAMFCYIQLYYSSYSIHRRWTTPSIKSFTRTYVGQERFALITPFPRSGQKWGTGSVWTKSCLAIWLLYKKTLMQSIDTPVNYRRNLSYLKPPVTFRRAHISVGFPYQS